MLPILPHHLQPIAVLAVVAEEEVTPAPALVLVPVVPVPVPAVDARLFRS